MEDVGGRGDGGQGDPGDLPGPTDGHPEEHSLVLLHPVEQVTGDCQTGHFAHILNHWSWEERVPAAPVKPEQTINDSEISYSEISLRNILQDLFLINYYTTY